MNYKISFPELATRNREILSKQLPKNLAEAKQQVQILKKATSQSSRKKKS